MRGDICVNILYCPSGHPLQEADDCLTFDKIGNWSSTGFYNHCSKPGDLPLIESPNKIEIPQRSITLGTMPTDKPNTLCGVKNMQWTGQATHNHPILNKELCKDYDIFVFAHFPENVNVNLSEIGDPRKIILKTYGMHTATQEKLIADLRQKGVRVVRNSPVEHRKYSNYAGHDAIIRGSVVRDEHELSGWIGNIKKICTFSSFFFNGDHYCTRRRAMYNNIISKCTYPAEIYGAMNPSFCSHQEKIDILQRYRVNLITGTPGSNNTYSVVEALVIGQPSVIFGPKMWQSDWCEVPEFIEHGKHAFIINSIKEGVDYISLLMSDDKVAQDMSIAARERGIELFGRENITNQWRNFLCT